MNKKINTDPIKVEEILTRGVAHIYNKEELRKKLLSGKQLHLKLGTDVTGPLIHLGHAVVHRKIRDFQELGHKVTLIIGDFTTIVGDHSDKVDMRTERTEEEIKKDEASYKQQFFKTVIEEDTTIRHNSEWLSNLKFNDVISLTKQFTVSQMIERENFKLRFTNGKPIRLSEFLYPLMQGYDSVALKSDVEFGGTDQTFNILTGRQLMESFNLTPQSGVIVKLLTGNDGRKMGKSLKNYIPVTAAPFDMYSQIMSIVDEIIIQYFELVTRVPMKEIEEMKEAIKNGANPMEFKKRLAREVVGFYHSEKDVLDAENTFERVVQNKDYSEIQEHTIQESKSIAELVAELRFVQSKGELKRLIEQNAVKFEDEVIKELDFEVNRTGVLKVGKKRIVRIIFG